MLPYVDLKLCDVSDGNLRVVRRRNCFSKLLVFPWRKWQKDLFACGGHLDTVSGLNNLCERMLTPGVGLGDVPLGA